MLSGKSYSLSRCEFNSFFQEIFWRLTRNLLGRPRPSHHWHQFGRRHHNPACLTIVAPNSRKSDPRCILIVCILSKSGWIYKHTNFHCWPVADCPVRVQDPLYIWTVLRNCCISPGNYRTARLVRIKFELASPYSLFQSTEPVVSSWVRKQGLPATSESPPGD